jgi:hypothetical protein
MLSGYLLDTDDNGSFVSECVRRQRFFVGDFDSCLSADTREINNARRAKNERAVERRILWGKDFANWSRRNEVKEDLPQINERFGRRKGKQSPLS